MSVMKLVGDSTEIEFDPAQRMRTPDILDADHFRATSGDGYSYKWSGKKRWEIPMDRISKSDSDQINAWWLALTSLTFYPDLINDASTSYAVLLRNPTAPLAEMQRPTFAFHYRGILLIEET